MLFFRSEERVEQWCRAQGVAKRPLVDVDQLWQLAVAWYGNRMSPDARRPGSDEVREIFQRIGLVGSFWEPQTDHFS
ncbi:MAG: hypothetical protein AMS18_09605 [Gemmatimonas sp. SG8_17]|nr:MAG: hypothetical protein AMS18_09605 [Gemmatimonas sp. SG8_17]